MRYLLLTLLSVFSAAAPAQELIEFENGQVANAEDLNQNLRLLLNEISELKSRVAALEPAPGCLSLRQVGDGVLLGDTENLFYLSNQVTISAWIRLQGDCNNEDGDLRRCNIFSVEFTGSSAPAGNSGITLEVYKPDDRLVFHFSATDSRQEVIETTEGLQRSDWTHVAAVRDGTQISLYVDGSLQVSQQVSSDADFAFDGSYYEHTKTHIGKGFPNGLGGLTDLFAGDLSRVGIWSIPLAPEDIQSMYQNSFDYEASNPAGFWPLNETSGSIAKDLSGFGNDGVLEGNATWSESCF